MSSDMPMTVSLSPSKVALVLAGIAIYLAAQSIILKHIQQPMDEHYWFDTFVSVVNINREQSIPTWFSSVVLLSCAVTLGLIARAKRLAGAAFKRAWTLLAVIFLYLAMDEAAALHEVFTEPVGEGLDTTGLLYFAWVIPGAVAVALFAVAYLRFWLHLPPRTRWQFFAAAAVYVGGALIVEMVSANQWYVDDGSSLAYSIIGTVEELMEMLGAIIFLHAVLRYLADYVGVVTLSLAGQHEPALAGTVEEMEAFSIQA